jgi:hypothetical protein
MDLAVSLLCLLMMRDREAVLVGVRKATDRPDMIYGGDKLLGKQFSLGAG